MPTKLALRDLCILALCMGAWALDGALREAGGPAAWVSAAAAAGLTAFVGFLVHEWGHLLGSWLTESRVHFPRHIRSLFLFHFDTRANDRRQFLAMSYGGFAASAAVVGLLVAVLPLEVASGKLALALLALGVLATVVLEVPTTVHVRRGGALPQGFVYEPIEPAAEG